jgi:hypothetical protein
VTNPRELKNFIGNSYADASSDARTELVNPSTGQVVATAPVSSEADVDAAYASAASAFAEWGQTTPSERQQALLKIADAIEARPTSSSSWSREHRQALALTEPKRSRRWSIRSASSPAPLASSKACLRRIHEGHDLVGSAASRSASSGRSPRGTTR